MTRSGFFLILCVTAAVVVGSLAIASNPGSGETTPTIESSLAVQKAVLQARDHLVRGEAKKAVEVLEANLSLINGDRRYLMLLRDAYRAYIRELSLANQPAAAEVYQKRLKILDENEAATQSPAPAQGANGPPQVTTSSTTQGSGPAPAPGPAPKAPMPPLVETQSTAQPSGQIARGSKPDPFDSANEFKAAPAIAPGPVAGQAVLAKADAEYAQKRYGEAKALYEQAFQADARLMTDDAKGRWAYCQMQVVVDQVNQFPKQPCNWAKLEADVKKAVSVAPHLAKTGDYLLAEMQKRRDSVNNNEVFVAVKHYAKGAHGYLTTETKNFRIYHNQTVEYAEKVAQVAEATRLQMCKKWFGKDGDEWTPKCDIYLHVNGTEYSRITGVPTNSPGHSRIETDPTNGRVVGRRIDVHCDNPSMLEAVLPHETTHVVLAGQFGNQPVPRWVDEGVAVLTEPAEKVNLHKKNLAKFLQNRELIPLRDLMQLPDYPNAAKIGTFYAQSVALVDYLTRLKGPLVFTNFVRDSLRDGYEAALRKHYSFQSFGELQDRWTERMLAESGASVPAYAERKN
jgi:tetratricopeptide (TPR) repeat protein